MIQYWNSSYFKKKLLDMKRKLAMFFEKLGVNANSETNLVDSLLRGYIVKVFKNSEEKLNPLPGKQSKDVVDF
jgi:hypothetical protein